MNITWITVPTINFDNVKSFSNSISQDVYGMSGVMFKKQVISKGLFH